MKKFLYYGIIIIIASLIFSGCSNNNSEIETMKVKLSTQEKSIEELTKENEQLKAELEEIKYGAERLLSQAQNYFEEKSYDKAKEMVNTLIQKHPSSKETEIGKQILLSIENELKKEADARALEEKRRIEAEKKRLDEATNKMRTKYDEVEGIKWYLDKSTTTYINRNAFYLYMGIDKYNLPWLRLKIQYTGDDWIFINKYIINVDGVNYEINAGNFAVNRDNDGGKVWEWYDIPLDKNSYDIVKAILLSNKAIIRCQGDTYHKDRTITSEEKKAIQNVLDAYEALGGIKYF